MKLRNLIILLVFITSVNLRANANGTISYLSDVFSGSKTPKPEQLRLDSSWIKCTAYLASKEFYYEYPLYLEITAYDGMFKLNPSFDTGYFKLYGKTTLVYKPTSNSHKELYGSFNGFSNDRTITSVDHLVVRISQNGDLIIEQTSGRGYSDDGDYPSSVSFPSETVRSYTICPANVQ